MKRFTNPIFLVLPIFLVAVIIIKPWGEFAINDDWDFFLHVREFSEGHFKKNSLIDSVFVLQGIIATGWVKVFGLSFNSLKSLTIIFTCIALVGFYKILTLYKMSGVIKTITLLSIAFNPFVFYSSMSFMTENYFLAFLSWSVYFFLKYIKDGNYKNLVFATLLGSLSMLVRQFGAVLFVAYFFIAFVQLIVNKERKYLGLPIILILFGLSFYIGGSWPQYSGDHTKRMATLFIGFKDFKESLAGLVYIIPYFAFFLSPLLMTMLSKYRKLKILGFLLLSLPIAYRIYLINVFNIGNVFYLEGILPKDDISIDLSLFNNNLFKIIFSVYLGLNTLIILEILIKWAVSLRKKISLDTFFLFLSVVGFVSCVVITTKPFDRYYIYAYLMGIIALGLHLGSNENLLLNKLKSKIIVFLPLLFLMFVSFCVVSDYYSLTKLRWAQATVITERTGYVKTIYVSPAFLKYNYVKKFDHFESVSDKTPTGSQYICYVQSYTVSSSQDMLDFIMLKKYKKSIPTPIIPRSPAKLAFSKIEDNLKRLTINQEYSSPMKNLIGLKAYVGSYCLSKLQ